MPEYIYPKLNPKWDLLLLTVRIFDALGLRPPQDIVDGLSDNGKEIRVIASRNLTSQEKNLLDGLMADPNAGLYPLTSVTYTVFEIFDVWYLWKALETALGKKIKYIFPNFPANKCKIWFIGTLSSAEKKKVIEEFAKTILESV